MTDRPWDPYWRLKLTRERRDAASGRKSISDRSRRASEINTGAAFKVSGDVIDVVFMLLEDTGGVATQHELALALSELRTDLAAGTTQGYVSAALLWMHREGIVTFVGREPTGEGGTSNQWKLAE